MGTLSAYATAARDVFASHGRHTSDLQAADSELNTAAKAAVAIADPDNSTVTYDHDEDDELGSLKSKTAAILKRLEEVTGVANALKGLNQLTTPVLTIITTIKDSLCILKKTGVVDRQSTLDLALTTAEMISGG